MSDEEIHDTSRLDAFMAARRRSMLLHSAWRPMLAGAAGAALVIAAVYVTLPKFSTREVVVDHVTVKDVGVDHVVAHDVPINNPIPHDVEIDIPRIVTKDVPGPQAEAKPLMGPQAPYAAKTPDENKFVDKPEYKTAPYKGRVVASGGGGALSFADGKSFYPAHWDFATSQAVFDPQNAFDAVAFIGDLGMCRPDANEQLWTCTALHDGKEAPITYRPPGRPT